MDLITCLIIPMTYISNSVSSRRKLFCTDNIVSHVMSLIGYLLLFRKVCGRTVKQQMCMLLFHSVEFSGIQKNAMLMIY